MSKPKVSIIIPVYNVEKYLPDCLRSALGQTLDGIEVLCVNDGSTDRSPAILREYAEVDPRVRVLHQKNQGVSSARNAGLAAAGGEYVRFLDGDDSLPLDACEKMYERAVGDKADILACGFTALDKDGKCIGVNRLPDATYDLSSLRGKRGFFSKHLSFGNQSLFYRRGPLNHVRFEPLSIGEDQLFFVDALPGAGILSTTRQIGYIYLERWDSATHQKKEGTLGVHMESRRRMIEKLGGNGDYAEVEGHISRRILTWAVRDFLEIDKVKKRAPDAFEGLYGQWKSCYAGYILRERRGGYLGEGIAKAVVRMDSQALYRFLALLVRARFGLAKSGFGPGKKRGMETDGKPDGAAR